MRNGYSGGHDAGKQNETIFAGKSSYIDGLTLGEGSEFTAMLYWRRLYKKLYLGSAARDYTPGDT
jgi:hypothetical protein